jgi:hypothetical protein
VFSIASILKGIRATGGLIGTKFFGSERLLDNGPIDYGSESHRNRTFESRSCKSVKSVLYHYYLKLKLNV